MKIRIEVDWSIEVKREARVLGCRSQITEYGVKS